jgi:chorismate mutase
LTENVKLTVHLSEEKIAQSRHITSPLLEYYKDKNAYFSDKALRIQQNFGYSALECPLRLPVLDSS